MVRVTRPGDPVTVGLTRLGQARVLEERPTRPSDRMLVRSQPLSGGLLCTVRESPSRLWHAFIHSLRGSLYYSSLWLLPLCGKHLSACKQLRC